MKDKLVSYYRENSIKKIKRQIPFKGEMSEEWLQFHSPIGQGCFFPLLFCNGHIVLLF